MHLVWGKNNQGQFLRKEYSRTLDIWVGKEPFISVPQKEAPESDEVPIELDSHRITEWFQWEGNLKII